MVGRETKFLPSPLSNGPQLSVYSWYVLVSQARKSNKLAYPATTVDVERMLSKGCLILSHIRNRLSVNSTRALLCLGAWSKLGFVRKADIHDAVTLPDLKEGDSDMEDELDLVL